MAIRARLRPDKDAFPTVAPPASELPIFGLATPTAVPGVPNEVLDPRGTWSDAAEYDTQAKKLAGMFRANFEKFGIVAEDIRKAGPQG